MASKPQRAAIYARISSDREGRELGVHDQEQDCRELAHSLGWTLHPSRPVYVDNDKGASSLSRKPRPQYKELLAAVRAGEVDGLLYWSNSRLTRRPREYESVIALVEDTGIRPPASDTGRWKIRTYLYYDLSTSTSGEYDHLVPLELGGANATSNLWIEPGGIPNAKDKVENRLHEEVCAGQLTLAAAQQAIAADWTTAQ